MVRTGLKAVFAMALACATFVGCGDKGTGISSGPSGTRMDMFDASYKIQGTKLIESLQLHIPGSNGCWGDSLHHQNDTIVSIEASVDLEISNDTLRMLYTPETTSTSRAVIVSYNQMTRKTPGTGIIGLWTDSRVKYRVISGTLTPSEKDSLEQAGYTDTPLSGLTFELEFTSTKIIYYSSGAYDFAQGFIYAWNYSYSYGYNDSMIMIPADSAKYDITLQKVSANKIILTGNKSHEVVTVTWGNVSGVFVYLNFTQVFTSSNAAHGAYSYYSNPQTCPNDLYPSWFDSFKSANAKPGFAKALAKKSRSAKGPISDVRAILRFLVR
jgi:hypothetical protein